MEDAADIIARLGLEPHPEGGYFRETFRDESRVDGRSAGTAIYYLLKAGETSHWHRIDAAEIWHFYAGAPLELKICESQAGPVTKHLLGSDIMNGERPQAVVPVGHWQSARSLGGWTLCGCTVAPGFEFDGFELAARDWRPVGDS